MEKAVALELTIVEEREKNADLREQIREGEKPLKRKVSQLDRNLEQLTIMYHKLVSQNSGLKVEVQVNEKKIARKEQRITQLERNLRDAKTKYEKLLNQCANLTAAVDHMSKGSYHLSLPSAGASTANLPSADGESPAAPAAGGVGGILKRPNIAKPLKGGSIQQNRIAYARNKGSSFHEPMINLESATIAEETEEQADS
eukprot:Platyproteum_vivax@DN2342_c0_g1_i1.p1